MDTKTIFVDTSALLSLFLVKDIDHEKADFAFNKYVKAGYRLITTDYVVDELLTLLRCREKVPVSRVIDYVQDVLVSNIQLYGVTQALFQDALEIMGKYKNHYFSFTDCISFQVMKDLKIKNVLTTDKDFEIAGVNNLLLKA